MSLQSQYNYKRVVEIFRMDEVEKIDEVMLPGFRFHPTDEELVGFYLKRKIQQRCLPIELIKQVDIYKYDPWDLPKLASTGEKEWYFYCPRDRKYRNSARPNRVTGAGFWKATGTDRPIYSSDGTKCIGLKKSLVFYRGRAARGLKTDWMMHEFRLPTTNDTTAPPKKFLDKNFPPNDSWAICRIFKKTNSMANRALSTWVSPPEMFNQNAASIHFSPENVSSSAETGSFLHLSSNLQGSSNVPSYTSPSTDVSYNFMFSSPQVSASMFFNTSPTLISDMSKTSESIDLEQLNSFSVGSSQELQSMEDETGLRSNHNSEWENIRSIGFPFSLTTNIADTWKHDLPWDSHSCPTQISTTYSPSS